jgi:lauroyl/myristoyl acyltransferase
MPPHVARGGTVVKPRWYSHGLNRLAYYRLARAAAAVLPRPVRLAVARAVARGVGRALPDERSRVRANLERVLAGAPVLPAFCTMARDGRYRIDVGAPIWVKPGEEMAGLEAMVTALEGAVRAHPTQWFNFFDVWAPPVGYP